MKRPLKIGRFKTETEAGGDEPVWKQDDPAAYQRECGVSAARSKTYRKKPAYQHPWRWELLPTNSVSPDFGTENYHVEMRVRITSERALNFSLYDLIFLAKWSTDDGTALLAFLWKYADTPYDAFWSSAEVIYTEGRDHESECTWHQVLHVALICHSKCAQPSATEHVSWQRACRASAPDQKNITTNQRTRLEGASSAHHVDISSLGPVRCLLGPYPLRPPLAPSSQIWWPPGGVKWQGRWCGPCWQPSSLLKGKRSLQQDQRHPPPPQKNAARAVRKRMKTGPTWSSASQHPWRWELLPTNTESPDFWDWKPSCSDACQR